MNNSFFKQAKLAFPVIIATLLSSATLAAAPVKTVLAPVPDATLLPTDQRLYDQRPWAILYYYGITGTNALTQIMPGLQFDRWPEHIQTLELEKTLDPDNGFRRFFSPIVGIVQLAGAVTVRTGSNQNTIYEVDPYINWRWANLPWNNYVTTSLSIGEGISYASSVPSVEKRDNTNTKRLLNLLIFEATFAAPSHPELQLVARIHHRSGAFGLYHAGNSGSNDIGLGIRYLFD
jgi:hypothetical protein